jgi:NAD-dependent deacetylase
MDLSEAAASLTAAARILVFTGAGISTDSGIPDFRGAEGLWSKMDPEDFSIGRFLSNPDIRRRSWRLHQHGELWGARSAALPNSGHHAVVDLWRSGRWAGCVTQNVDGLHQLAGLPEEEVAELHGNVRRAICHSCRASWDVEEILQRVDAGEEDPCCQTCSGVIKTSTVMFGEFLPEDQLEMAWLMAATADAVLAVGSTLSVFPASDIPREMAMAGRPMVIVNLGSTELDHLATVKLDGRVGELLPDLVRIITSS